MLEHTKASFREPLIGLALLTNSFVVVRVKCQTGYLQVVRVGMIISSSEWWGGAGVEWRERKTEKRKTLMSWREPNWWVQIFRGGGGVCGGGGGWTCERLRWREGDPNTNIFIKEAAAAPIKLPSTSPFGRDEEGKRVEGCGFQQTL